MPGPPATPETPAPANDTGPAPPRAAQRSERFGALIRAPFAGVPGPFRVRQRDTDFDPHASPLQERAMRAFWWDGFWASGSETIILNYLGLYLLAFGSSNAQVGLLALMSSLFAALAFFPGARLVEAVGRRRSRCWRRAAGSDVSR